MANTRMSAKNSFLEGLILDISPENMSATSMSSALNATLLTFNGNEMVLLNDMGNGRVETAFLPEGYVPVGTCEFGDIIYIVSYNPLINKSQIGCFPSPERNISTEELGGLGQSLQSSDFQEMSGDSPTGKLKATSVKKILYDNRDMTPGDKYIIYSEDLDRNNTNLSDYGNTSHTHDTFPKLVKIHVVSIEESGKIVYLDSTTRWYDNDSTHLYDNDYYLSNKGKKDNGKIDLDSYRDLLSSGYSIFSSKVSGKLALLVELEKITGFSCAWEAYSLNGEESDNTDYSIYMHYNWTTEHNDVNPDGVALLISEWSEINGTRGLYQKWSNTDKKFTLNLPINIGINLPQSSNTLRYKNGFTRHYSQESNISYSTYESIKYDKRIEDYLDAYKLNINKTLEGIPIPGEYYINCTKLYEGSYYSGTNRIYPNSIDDSIVNNYFHYPIIKHFGNFNIPTKQTFNVDGEKIVKYPNINNLIYHYKIAPTMPYGILEEYALEGYIDFSKLGKRHINLNTWKYYNYENTSTLTWGMEAYTEPNKGIQEIVFEFYDNNGFVAAYHTKDKLSYNGVFTEYLTLNESGTNYKLNNIKAFPELDSNTKEAVPTYHKGLEVTKETAVPGFKYQHKNGGNWIDFDELGEGDYYMDDSGTLYSNCLYLVKIVIKYCNKNVLDEYIDLTSEEEAIVDYRWYWTNNMFNEYYYQEKDFANLLATLTLDSNIVVKENSNYEIKNYNYLANVADNETVSLLNPYKSLSANILTINIDETLNDNIKLALIPGLLETYNTFNLNKSNLSELKSDIYLAKSFISNTPENPEVICSEENVPVDNKYINPINEELCTGKLNLKQVSETLSELLELTTKGEGSELNSEEGYKNYKNNFLLYSTENKVSTNKGPKKNGELTYIDSLSEPVTITEFDQYSNTVNNILYDDDFSKYFKLTISGIHYSKYLYLTKVIENSKLLRSFVLNTSDLNNYNLIYEQNTLHFIKMLMTSVADHEDRDVHLLLSILLFEKQSNGLYKRTIIKRFDDTDGGASSDNSEIDVHTSLLENFDDIANNFTFLFPFGYSHCYRENGKNWNTSPARKNNNDPIISNNVNYEDTTYFSGRDLGGTLAGITDEEIEPANLHTSSNVLEYFAPYVLGFLTQLFYLTDSDLSLTMPNNYIYLNNSYCSYKRDTVIHLYCDLYEKYDYINNNNRLINFRGFDYLWYLDKVVENFYNKEKLKSSSNVAIKIESSLKNHPIEFKFNYIPPIQDIFGNTKVLIASIFEDIPTVIDQSFLPNTLYGWDDQTLSFKVLGDVPKLKKISNFNITDNMLKSKLSDNNTNLYLKDLNKYRLLSVGGDNILRLSEFPASLKDYCINTHSKKSNQGKNRSLSGYKTFVFYENY